MQPGETDPRAAAVTSVMDGDVTEWIGKKKNHTFLVVSCQILHPDLPDNQS